MTIKEKQPKNFKNNNKKKTTWGQLIDGQIIVKQVRESKILPSLDEDLIIIIIMLIKA